MRRVWGYAAASLAAVCLLLYLLLDDDADESSFISSVFLPLTLLSGISSNVLAAASAVSALLADEDLEDDALACDVSVVSSCPAIANTRCGWCWDDNTPRRGGHRGDAAGNCSDWTWYANRCPLHYECSDITACVGILSTACGWCASSGRAMRGGVAGPLTERCDGDGSWIAQWQRCPVDPQPQQAHLMYGENATVMSVTWSTALNASVSMAWYRDDDDEPADGVGSSPLLQATASVRLFLENNRRGLHFVHRANMTRLRPGHRYTYWLQTGAYTSRNFSFRAQQWPAAAASSSSSSSSSLPERFIVYGDMGRYGGAPALRPIEQELRASFHSSDPVAAVIHIGDFAYDLSDSDGVNGDAFMSRIERVAATVPYLTSPGNHEMEADYQYSHYRARFSMPRSEQRDGFDMYWSLNVGLIHFISYSTEQPFSHPQDSQRQLDWLQRDLQEANEHRQQQPWIVAFGHRPMYCSNADGDDCTTDESVVRRLFELLFDSQGVDLVLEAHEHSYERLFPVYDTLTLQRDYINPAGCVHVVTGTAGCNEQGGLCINAIPGPRGDWSAFHIANRLMYGYGHLQAFNSTHLYWDEVMAEEGTQEHRIDSIWIVQEKHGNFSRRRQEKAAAVAATGSLRSIG